MCVQEYDKAHIIASSELEIHLSLVLVCRGVVAVLTAAPFREDSIPQRLITLAEGLFEVVSHALFLRPPALQAMLPPEPQPQGQFFDVWLTVAQIRYVC